MRLSSVSAESSAGCRPRQIASTIVDVTKARRQMVDVTLAENLIPRDFGERVRTAGRSLVKPRPRTRYSFER